MNVTRPANVALHRRRLADRGGAPAAVRLTQVPGFTLKAVAIWAKTHLVSNSAVFSNGLACFGAVTEAGCSHHPTVMAGRKPKDAPEFKWINTILGNLKTSFQVLITHSTFTSMRRAILPLCYRFNRRFDLRSLSKRLLVAAITTTPHPLRIVCIADVHC